MVQWARGAPSILTFNRHRITAAARIDIIATEITGSTLTSPVQGRMQYRALVAIGTVFFVVALTRFRKTLSQMA